MRPITGRRSAPGPKRSPPTAARTFGALRRSTGAPAGKPRWFAQDLVNAAGLGSASSRRHPAAAFARKHPAGTGIAHRDPQALCASRCYIFQNIDKRIIFAIPYEGDFTLIGTTEGDYVGDPGEVTTTAEDVDYLCQAANRYFSMPITPADVVWTYSGVRPLYDDGASEAQAATRDYVLDLDETGAPMLSIFGGKITTYRRLADTRSTSSNGICQLQYAPAATGPARCPCRAAIFRSRASRPSLRRSVETILGWPRISRVASPEHTAQGARGSRRRDALKFTGPGLRLRSDRG